MAHLRFGIQQGGGFVLLTGEVGTGKTTLCRSLLSELPADIDVALILNPRISELELLEAVCDELRVPRPDNGSLKQLLDPLNRYLLDTHAGGRRTVLIVDESQKLILEVLEQIRLLTNLETTRAKLLQIVLIGQPELVEMLSRPSLRQLSQRVTARYHLLPLSARETGAYIRYRLARAGCTKSLFSNRAIRLVHRLSGGVPRLINVICDRALLGAYAHNRHEVDAATVETAGQEVLGVMPASGIRRWMRPAVAAGLLLAVVSVIWRLSDMPKPVLSLTWPGREAPAHTQQAPDVPVESTPALASTRDPGLDGNAMDLRLRLEATAPPAGSDTAPAGPLAQALTDAAGDYNDATARLLALWGEYPGPAANCASIAQLGLQCLSVRGDWDRLRFYNRPAIMALSPDSAESPKFGVITGIDGEHVWVDLDGVEARYPIVDVARLWDGQFTLVWRPVSGTGPDTDGERQWMRDALTAWQDRTGRPARVPDGPNPEQWWREQLSEFQRESGVVVSGSLDVDTIMRLNEEMNDGAVPVLIN